jgi:hypothetical protein
VTNQLYICDPKLNKDCPKTSCVHNALVVDPHCYATKNIMFAKKPVEKVIMVIDVGDEIASVVGDNNE